MTRRVLEVLTIPAWCLIFVTLGALLGLLAYTLSWALAYVKALL